MNEQKQKPLAPNLLRQKPNTLALKSENPWPKLIAQVPNPEMGLKYFKLVPKSHSKTRKKKLKILYLYQELVPIAVATSLINNIVRNYKNRPPSYRRGASACGVLGREERRQGRE